MVQKFVKSKVGLLTAFATAVIGITTVLANLTSIIDFAQRRWSAPPTPTLGSATEPLPTPTLPPPSPTTSIDTPTLVPTPPVIYDWTYEDRYSTSGGWDVIYGSLGETFYAPGEYVVRTKRGNILYIGLWEDLGTQFEEGTLEVSVQRPAAQGSSDTAGIVFGKRDDLQGNSYAFTVDKQGNCQFREESYGGWKLVNSGVASQFLPDLESHKITVVVRDNRAYGYVDDEFCADVVLVAYIEGYIGVAAHSTTEQTDGGKAYFDDFRVVVE